MPRCWTNRETGEVFRELLDEAEGLETWVVQAADPAGLAAELRQAMRAYVSDCRLTACLCRRGLRRVDFQQVAERLIEQFARRTD